MSMRTYAPACALAVVALFKIACGGKAAPSDLKVTGSPTGEVTGKIHLTVAFSRPMIARDQVDKPVASPPVQLSPELAGEAKWSDDKTLVVWPKGDLPISTRYVATVPK